MSTEQRIELLERRCRWLFAALAGIVVVGGVAVFTGAAQNDGVKNLRIESLEIIDGTGKVRVRLGDLTPRGFEPRGKEGMYGMQIKDAEGDIRAWLHDRAQLRLQRGDGRVSLAATEIGANIQVEGPERLLAQIAALEDYCIVRLMDNEGKDHWQQATPRALPGRQKVVDPFR